MKKLSVLPLILFLAVTLILIAIPAAASDQVTVASMKARVVEIGYTVLAGGQANERPTYRVDIGDTAIPNALARLRHPAQGEHIWNAKVFAKTIRGIWIHKNFMEIPQKPATDQRPPATREEFEAMMKAIEDEREVSVSDLPAAVRDLPPNLLSQVWAVWYFYDNGSITLYLEGDESRQVAEKIVAVLNATKM